MRIGDHTKFPTERTITKNKPPHAKIELVKRTTRAIIPRLGILYKPKSSMPNICGINVLLLKYIILSTERDDTYRD